MAEFELQSADGLLLRGRTWEVERPLAVVCLVHGLGEHTGRYGYVAKVLNEAGIAVMALDLRGHGLSEGPRGHAPSYKVLMDDLSLFLETARNRYPEIPLFLYGHSLGGNLVLYHALESKPNVAGIVASAPLLRLAFAPPTWKTQAMRWMQRLHMCTTLPSGLDVAALSRDPDIIQAYCEDPLVHDKVSSVLASEMLQRGEELLQHAGEFTYPLLLLHGEADRITSTEATRTLATTVSADCTLKTFPGMFHEPHNDPEKDAVMASIIDWIKRYS